MSRICCGQPMKRIGNGQARVRLWCPTCGSQKGLTDRRGRPPLPDAEKKKNRTLRLSDDVWCALLDIGQGQAVQAIEMLVQKHQKS